MDLSKFVDEKLFPPVNLEQPAQRVVKYLNENSKYYNLLHQEPPRSDEGNVQFLIDYWTSERERAMFCAEKFDNFIGRKQ